MGLSGGEISILDALIIWVIGMLIFFAVLIFLRGVVMLRGLMAEKSPALAAKRPKIRFKKKKRGEEGGEAAPAELAPGTCGELVLVKTEERDAAMIMAIVADALGTPLNELRFKSIKRVDGEDAATDKAED